MIRYLLVISTFFLWGCHSSTKNIATTITIDVNNIKHDSIGFRLITFIGGRELLDTILPVGKPLIVHNMKEDMYLLALSWPRTLVPHQVFRNKDFDPQKGDVFTLTKAIYIKPSESDYYKIFLDSMRSAEEIEINGIKELNVFSGNCFSCLLAETYLDNYNTFFDRKKHLVAELNETYYKAVDNKDTTARKKFLNAVAAKNNLDMDSLFRYRLDSIVSQNSSDPISTFFVFYQLYHDRDFKKYKPIFDHLKGHAKKSKYYKTLEKQYELL